MSDETWLDRAVGPNAIVVTVGGTALDLTVVGAVTIRHGRENADAQPNAATASLAILAGALSTPPWIGDTVDIELGADAQAVFELDSGEMAAAIDRFHGNVTDVSASLDGHGRAVYGVVAVSGRAVLGRTYIGDEPWPAELDGERAARILGLASVTTSTPDPGTVTVRARDIDHQPALGLLDKLAQDASAVLVEYRNGLFDWHDAEHRRNVPSALTLSAAEVLSPLSWEMTASGVVNDLTLIYGSADPRLTVTEIDQTSIDSLGPFAVRVETDLDAEADALASASLTIARRSHPWWRIGTLMVVLERTVVPTQAARLLALNTGDLLAVTGFPSAGPFTTTRLWVEGWTEVISATSWSLTLAVSDFATTGPPARWIDVDTDMRWGSAATVYNASWSNLEVDTNSDGLANELAITYGAGTATHVLTPDGHGQRLQVASGGIGVLGSTSVAVPVDNVAYTVTARLKVDALDTGGDVTLTQEFYNSVGGFLTYSYEQLHAADPGVFGYLFTTATAPTGTTAIQVKIGIGGGGDITIESLSVEPDDGVVGVGGPPVVNPNLTWRQAVSWDPDPFGTLTERYADTASDLHWGDLPATTWADWS